MRWMLVLLVIAGVLGATMLWRPPAGQADLTFPYVSIETLDPTQMQASEDIRAGFALFEGLTRFNPYTFTIEPGVAERWTVSEDGRTYRFQLRADARWSNGDLITAGDFVATWRQNLMPDFAAPYQQFLMFIDGGQAYFDWCAAERDRIAELPDAQKAKAAAERVRASVQRFDELVGVRAISPTELEVRLEKATPYFTEIVGCWPLFPLHESVRQSTQVDAATRMLVRDHQWTKPGRMISNGPYQLAGWQFKGSIELQANPHYWNRGAVRSASVRLLNVSDHVAAFNAYQSGAVDVVFGTATPFRADLVDAARDGRRNDVHAGNNWGTYFYAFNNRPKLPNGMPNPFADVRVRRAFAMVIDKQALVRDVTRMNQQVARTFIPPSSIPGYDAPAGADCISDAATPDERQAMIEKARALLVEAGYDPPASFPTVVLMFNTGGGHEPVALAISAMWRKAFGVDVSVKTHEWKVFLREYSEGNYMVARASWFGDYGDPTTFLDLFQTGNGNNDTAFSDPHYDGLLARAAGETDRAKRFDLLEQAEAYVMDEQLPMVPLYHYRLVHLFDPDRVHGVSLHPRNLQMLHLIEVTGP